MSAIPELILLGFETTQLCASETVSGGRVLGEIFIAMYPSLLRVLMDRSFCNFLTVGSQVQTPSAKSTRTTPVDALSAHYMYAPPTRQWGWVGTAFIGELEGPGGASAVAGIVGRF